MTSDSAAGKSGRSGGLVESVGFVCLTCICVATAVIFVVNATRIWARPARFEIEDRVNPNYASPASLARLPRIGPARAREIVFYRHRFIEQAGQRLAFDRAEDLGEVTGIGPATIEAIRPWLSFDSLVSRAPTTAQGIQGDSEADSLE
jgi:hypothetical protein